MTGEATGEPAEDPASGGPRTRRAGEEYRLRLEETGIEVVHGEADLAALVDLLLGARKTPIVVLTQSEDTLQPVLPAERLRNRVEAAIWVYYISDEDLLAELRWALGRELAVCRGAARIYWPGLALGCDPGAHPLVQVLDDEREEDALGEFARQFDLSRPQVRREIELIEDARSMLLSEVRSTRRKLWATAEQLRDANIARHEAVMRAERAEGAKSED